MWGRMLPMKRSEEAALPSNAWAPLGMRDDPSDNFCRVRSCFQILHDHILSKSSHFILRFPVFIPIVFIYSSPHLPTLRCICQLAFPNESAFNVLLPVA